MKKWKKYSFLAILGVGLVAGVLIFVIFHSSNKNVSPEKTTPEQKPPEYFPPSPNSDDKYAALIPTKKEREYLKGENNNPLPVSSVGCGTDRLEHWNYTEGRLVAGSALMTDTLDGSGKGSSILNDKGITHIIHSVNQPYSAFNNNEDFYISYIAKSVQNCILLADREKFEKLAVPFVGGGTYLGNCDPQKLAEGIIRGAVNQLKNCPNLKGIIFVDWGVNSNYYLLEKVDDLWKKSELAALRWEFEEKKHFRGTLFDSETSQFLNVEVGDIRDKRIHEASAIVNAANIYLGFGSGVSGAIAEQVGDKIKIERKAQEIIREFNH